jgi:hypothetical protein
MTKKCRPWSGDIGRGKDLKPTFLNDSCLLLAILQSNTKMRLLNPFAVALATFEKRNSEYRISLIIHGIIFERINVNRTSL